MRTSTRVALALIVCSIIALAIMLLRPRQISDSQQIQDQLQSAVQGANEHAIGAIMSVVSDDYRDDNNLDSYLLRALLGDAFRDDPGLTVSITPAVVSVTGLTATSDCTISVVDHDAQNDQYTRNFHLSWRKEQTYRFLVFPTTVWHVVSGDYGSLSSFGSQ